MSNPERNPIKEAFAKAKEDIFNLSAQLESLKREISSLKETLQMRGGRQTNQQTDNSTQNMTQIPAENAQKTALQHRNTAYDTSSTDNPAQNKAYKAVKSQNSDISTGNEGVSTDRQTDQQTDNSTGNEGVKVRINTYIPFDRQTTNPLIKLEKVSEFLNSLDNIKKELRLKIKSLTHQEFSVFFTIYQCENEGFIVDYSLLSQKLNLTESSIRDYVQRILKKGLPLQKTKENNKRILLSIAPDLKRIASLPTIQQLREI